VALVPGVLALLPEYAGVEDPVAELRAACVAAVSWLGGEVVVLGDAQGVRVGESLLEAAGVSRRLLAQPPQPPVAGVSRRLLGQPPQPPQSSAYLVVGNGSAKRSEKAPGHLDARAEGFDARLGESLRTGRPEVDAALARELWASVEGIEELAGLGELGQPTVDFDDATFGVQYWVMRWLCES
jgi:hypothetical protein